MRVPIQCLSASAAFAACLAGCASPYVGRVQAIPEQLKAPANQTLAVVAQANGAQIYECNASKADSLRFEWVLKAPEADLHDNAGRKIGKHYAGPTWEADDGSKAVGEVKARADGPDVNAIPWLLMSAKSTDGKGIFSNTQSVQRVNTVGGKAPADGCNQAQLGKLTRIAYRATYNFYVAGS